MRPAAVFISALMSAGVYGADDSKERAKLPPELEPVFGLAMAAPPEFAAGALLRITPRVLDRALRRELIEMAFHLAGKAQNPVRLASFPGIEPETRSSYLSNALALKLDTLSLQARSVQEMLRIDPARARELFSEIAAPRIAAATCEQSLLPDISPYYESLAAVTQGTFSEKERAKSEHLAFATAVLSRVSALAELAPAAHAVATIEWPRQYLEIAVGSLSGRLESVGPDSRSFLYFSKSIDSSVELLIRRAKQLGIASDPLAQTYRKFLVTQFRGPHCADSGQPAGRIVQMGQPTDLFGDAIRGELPAIANEEMTPESIEGTMKLDRFWQSGEAERMYTECLKLRQGSDGSALSEPVRRSREWSRQMTDFLNTLANWSTNGEASEADFYHQKAVLYEALLELAPAGEMNESVIQSFIGFLKSSNVQRHNGVEWFWHARSTVDRVRPSHPDQAAKIMAAYRSSGNIVLMLEAMLDQVAPATPEAQGTANH